MLKWMLDTFSLLHIFMIKLKAYTPEKTTVKVVPLTFTLSDTQK